MYCNQCEQTTKGIACTTRGICGKDEQTAALQDLLTTSLKELSVRAEAASSRGLLPREVNRFVLEALFATLTNVNFDPERIADYIRKARGWTEQLQKLLKEEGGNAAGGPDTSNLEVLSEEGRKVGLPTTQIEDPDIRSLQEIVLYGIRGVAAYAHHAAVLGEEDQKVYDYIFHGLSSLGRIDLGMQDWVNLALQCGEINILAMQLLDAGNTGTFGHPQPTSVPLGHKPGKCILVSGHDLYDLQRLLEATAGKGIMVYTHGEMLPAHGYPELKKHPHLYGHYGTGWQNQAREFAAFPGSILMTTNCIQKPQESYKENIFTTGSVGWPGVHHLANGEYQLLIDRALELPGFSDEIEKGQVMVGFARQAVLGVADQVIAAVKTGQIKHFFLVGGCDGVHKERSYFGDFVDKTPEDTVILTLGCGKFRFFDHQLGDIGGIPRLLDVGQCNDAYSAVQIALALADAFGCGVNDLPLSLVISWFEQKAVSILLSLLYLGIKNIRLGPTLPAFITPNVLKFLVENYAIKPITGVEEDLAAILG
ncbi:MAG TPA: hydroxylamine reductase [Syntrophomonadaceae bacterium]|nr:hydroxylamine reductase [Syntrophomonadaceae bacterium]